MFYLKFFLSESVLIHCLRKFTRFRVRLVSIRRGRERDKREIKREIKREREEGEREREKERKRETKRARER